MSLLTSKRCRAHATSCIKTAPVASREASSYPRISRVNDAGNSGSQSVGAPLVTLSGSSTWRRKSVAASASAPWIGSKTFWPIVPCKASRASSLNELTKKARQWGTACWLKRSSSSGAFSPSRLPTSIRLGDNDIRTLAISSLSNVRSVPVSPTALRAMATKSGMMKLGALTSMMRHPKPSSTLTRALGSKDVVKLFTCASRAIVEAFSRKASASAVAWSFNSVIPEVNCSRRIM